MFEEDLPRWHLWKWQADPPALLLGIRRELLPFLPQAFASGFDLEYIRQVYGLGEFRLAMDGALGFANCLEWTGEEGGYAWLKATLPAINFPGAKPCPDCKQRGRVKKTCLECSGTGKLLERDLKRAEVISCSLSLLNSLLYEPEAWAENVWDILPPEPQLFRLQLHCEEGLHGHGITGEIGPGMRNLLRQGPPDMPEVVKAIKSAFVRMDPYYYFDENEFRLRIEPSGTFLFKCPGQSCDVGADGNEEDRGTGYFLVPHNIDSPHNQLALLAGFCALSDSLAGKAKQ